MRNPHFDITYTINGSNLTKKVSNQLEVLINEMNDRLAKEFKNKPIWTEKSSSCVELRKMSEPPTDYDE